MINFHENEKILAKHHKHWFILVGSAIPLLFILFVPIILMAVFTRGSFSAFFGASSGSLNPWIAMFAASAWFLLIWIRFFATWTDYYLDVWIATDKRIIDIEQKGFFNREVSQCRYEQVQDVTVDVRGFIATILDFGDIHVQTAGEKREIIIRGVAHPNHLRDFISAQHDQVLSKQRFEWQELQEMKERARNL
jgi:uncharacterized membrane protein YdbT with pleckstrin-like domain